MRFRKTDRRNERCSLAVLLQAPGSRKVPPFRTVENKIEAATREPYRLREGTTQRFSKEARIWVRPFQTPNQRPPQFRRQFVGSVAAEAADSHRRIMFCQVCPISPKPVAVFTVVNFEQVAPGDHAII